MLHNKHAMRAAADGSRGLPSHRIELPLRDRPKSGPVICVSQENWHRHGRLLKAQYRLRHKTFIERRYWDGVQSYKNLEYDSYDTPAAHYLVRPDMSGSALGLIRLSPTDRPYMLKDNWPDMSARQALPSSLSVWEMTRFCVDQELPRDFRTQVKNELICALVEFCLRNDIRQVIAVMHPRLWQSVFIDMGLDVEFVGDERMLGDGIARAALVRMTISSLKKARHAWGTGYVALG